MMTHEARKAKARAHSRKVRSDPAYRAREYAKNREYQRTHRQSINDTNRPRRRAQYANDEEYRASVIRNSRNGYRRLRDRLFAGYGSKCACCGERERDFLELDHVNGGGKKHYFATNPLSVYREVILAGFPPIYRLLCANCNRGRQRNGGRCPHEDMVVGLAM